MTVVRAMRPRTLWGDNFQDFYNGGVVVVHRIQRPPKTEPGESMYCRGLKNSTIMVP